MRSAASARWALWLPPLLVGAAVSASVATSTALLLYEGEGMARAVLAIAGVTVLSLALGFWTGTTDPEQEQVPSAARWWVGLLVALVFAAGFSGVWDAFQGFGASRAAQGTGLALMTALPTYFGGGVLGRIGSFSTTFARGLKGRVAIGAGLGIALGTAVVISALGRPLLAVTAFLGAAIAASLGARIQGWIFDRVPRRRLLLKEDGRPELRLEVWHTAKPDLTVRILSNRGEAVVQDPPADGSWQDGVSRTLEPSSPLLFLGTGSWFPVEREAWSVFEPDEGIASISQRGFGWSADRFAGGPIPLADHSTVVVERNKLDAVLGAQESVAEYIQALERAGALRIWVGGVRVPLPTDLIDACLAEGYDVRAYAGRVEGGEGPPAVAARWERLWCFQKHDIWPAHVGGLVLEASEPAVSE